MTCKGVSGVVWYMYLKVALWCSFVNIALQVHVNVFSGKDSRVPVP